MNEKTESSERNLIKIAGNDGVERQADIYSKEGFLLLSDLWTRSGWQQKISYEVTWLGTPIIQLPEDILMFQEVIYKTRPDVIVETGTARGGTAIFFASILELLGRGRVISVDVEIRKHNRLAIQTHPMSKRITLIESSSVDEAAASQVRRLIDPTESVLVFLDSNHTFAHVRQEMDLYAALVKPGGYLVVMDSVMEKLADAPNGRPEWAKDNPGPAIRDFLSRHKDFSVDPYFNRLEVTYGPGGFLLRK